MGLLDSLFDGSTYGGQGGGLLDMLRNAQMQNSQPSLGFPDNQPSPLDNAQYPSGPNGAPSAPATFADRFNAMPNAPQPFNPSGRTFDAAQFNPATYAPNQAEPIAVGNYQMPRIGNAPQFAGADPAALPPNAQPTQGGPLPGLQPQAQQQETLPPALGGNQFGGRLGAAGANFVNAGSPLQALFGGITGLATGQRTDPQGIQQQNLAAQFHATRQALISNGIPEAQANSTAMLATLNPEAAKTVLPELLTNKEKFHTIKDSFGNEVPAFVNEIDQTINGKPIGQGGAGGVTGDGGGVQQMADKISAMRASGASQEQMLNEVPSMYRGYVKSLIAGDAVPTNIGRSQARGALMTLAHAVDDHFDESLIPQRMTYARGIGDTKSTSAPGGQRQAINTATGHFADLAEALVAQNNANGGVLAGAPGSGPLATAYNAIANSSSKNSENTAKILQEADSTAGEMGKLYSGSQGGGVHEREATKSRYSPNLPPLQAAGALQATRDLLLEKIKSNEAARDQAFGPDAKERIDFMDDSVKRNLARVDAAITKLKGETTSSPGAPDRSAIEAEMRRRGLMK